MAKGNSKEEKKIQKKAKKYEGCWDQESVAVARKLSESGTLPKGQKRVRDSDGENIQRDPSSKEGKKRKKEAVVERLEECNSAADNCQSKGKQKEREANGKLKPRGKRTQELTNSEQCKLRNFGEGQLVNFGKGDRFKESSDQESLKEKRKKKVRGNDSSPVQNREEHENRENSKGTYDNNLKKSSVVVGKKRTKKRHDDNTFFEEQHIVNPENINDVNRDDIEIERKKKKKKTEKELNYTFDTQNNEGLHEKMLETWKEAVQEEVMNNEGKKEKKKSRKELQEESKSALHPAIDYLHTWYNNRQHWNFKKVRQVWLLKNMFDQEQISDENFDVLLKYLEGLEGAAKEKTIKMAEQRLDSGEGGGEQDTVIESRVQQVLQMLTE